MMKILIFICVVLIKRYNYSSNKISVCMKDSMKPTCKRCSNIFKYCYFRCIAFKIDNEFKTSITYSQEVTDFCTANGKWYLSITTLEQSNPYIAYTMHTLIER